MKDEFKPGMQVYCPKFGAKVYTLEKPRLFCMDVMLTSDYGRELYLTKYGLEDHLDKSPSIFLATHKNRKALIQLYNIEFEDLAKKANTFIQYKINNRQNCLCILGAEPIKRVESISQLTQTVDIITDIVDDNGIQYKSMIGVKWQYAEPVAIDNNGNITYLTDNI